MHLPSTQSTLQSVLPINLSYSINSINCGLKQQISKHNEVFSRAQNNKNEIEASCITFKINNNFFFCNLVTASWSARRINDDSFINALQSASGILSEQRGISNPLCSKRTIRKELVWDLIMLKEMLYKSC